MKNNINKPYTNLQNNHKQTKENYTKTRQYKHMRKCGNRTKTQTTKQKHVQNINKHKINIHKHTKIIQQHNKNLQTHRIKS